MHNGIGSSNVDLLRENLAERGVNPFAQRIEARAIAEDTLLGISQTLSVEELDEQVGTLLSEVIGYGPLQAFLDDPDIEEIWLNEPSRVFVARKGMSELTTMILDDEEVRDLVERMLQHSGRHLDLASPFVDATLVGGERLHVVIPPVTGKHWSVNIRKHIQRARSLSDLVDVGTIPISVANFLSAAMDVGLSIIVSGATQAGKTTLMRALSGEIPRSRRIITCEEVFELNLLARDCVALQTRPTSLEGKGEVNLRDLVRESLRMRPECLIVGEVRGPEALDLLLALNAGVPGMATVHANSAHEALDKLSILPLLAGENVTSDFVVPTLASSVDLVCHMGRKRNGQRFLAEVLAVPGRMEGRRIETSQLWEYDGNELQRQSGTIDAHERFSGAGYRLSDLLSSGVEQ